MNSICFTIVCASILITQNYMFPYYYYGTNRHDLLTVRVFMMILHLCGFAVPTILIMDDNIFEESSFGPCCICTCMRAESSEEEATPLLPGRSTEHTLLLSEQSCSCFRHWKASRGSTKFYTLSIVHVVCFLRRTVCCCTSYVLVRLLCVSERCMDRRMYVYKSCLSLIIGTHSIVLLEPFPLHDMQACYYFTITICS
jgi:hypothetical protein